MNKEEGISFGRLCHNCVCGALGDSLRDFRQIFTWAGTTISVTYPHILGCVVMSILANGVVEVAGKEYFRWLRIVGHILLSMPLSFLLVFRINFAIQRYFSGRALVGKMVHAVRELARGISTYVDADGDHKHTRRKAECARLLKAYVICVRLSLRKIEQEKSDGQLHAMVVEQLKPLMTRKEYAKFEAVKKNLAFLVSAWLGDEIKHFKEVLLFDRAMDFMEKNVSDLMQAWMGMQSIATTPMPFPYVQMLWTLLYVFAYSLPWPLAVKYGWQSVAITLLMMIALFGLDQIGKELEDPFGEEYNDLDFEFFENGSVAACKLMLPPIEMPDHSAEDTAGVATPLAGLPRNHPVQKLEEFLQNPQLLAIVTQEITNALTPRDLSPSMQLMLSQYFDLYDKDASGLIEEKERLQLVTKLSFALKLEKPHLENLLGAIEQVKTPKWNKGEFADWFLVSIKASIHKNKQAEGQGMF